MFGVEFVTMNFGVETLCAIQYKLRIDIPISGPSHIYENNMLVIHNITKPELTLKKKCNAIVYLAIHESVAMRESLTRHIRLGDIPASLIRRVVT